MNIKNIKPNVTLHTEGTTAEVRKALAKAESLAKVWIESTIDLLGEIVPTHPIHWANGDYITKVERIGGEIYLEIGHREWLKTQTKYAMGKWIYPRVQSVRVEQTNYSWVELYENLAEEKITERI